MRSLSPVSRLRLMALAVLAFLPAPAFAGLIGGDLYISGVGGMFADVAYNSVSDSYLVVWGDCSLSPVGVSGRLVSVDGALLGSQSRISETSAYAVMPSVAYNSTDNEYLVVWIDQRGGDLVYGRRVSAAGAPVGASFQISTIPQSLCAVAWSSASNCYYVTYHGGGNTEVSGRRVSIVGGTPAVGAELNISNNPGYSGYSDVCYASTGNQFLVSWEQEDVPDVPRIVGQRVSASSGALIGGPIDLTAAGGRSRACIAYDSVSSRWLVQFNDSTHPGNSVDQYGQLVDTNGGLVGSNFAIAASPDMEGDSLRHSAVSFAPTARRFISSFHRGIDMVGQEVGLGGAPIGDPVYVTSYASGTEAMGCSNAVDFERNRCLFAWYNLEGAAYYVHVRLYELNPAPPPGPVTNLVVRSPNQQNNLTWTNPVESAFTGTMIRYRTDTYPTSPTDGTLVVDKPGSPGASETYAHSGLTNGVTYYYTAWAHGAGPTYSVPKHAWGVPTTSLCFQDAFSYPDGGLNGNGGWSGTATSQIVVSGQTVRIPGYGDTATYGSARTTTCSGGTSGIIWLRVRIQQGVGDKTLWSLRLNDTSGANLARWYGTGTTARPRIGDGTSVLAPQTLSGPGVWDVLDAKIYTATDTSEFFFNGTSLGTLSHSGAGNTAGELKFEAVGNSATSGHYIYLDDLTLGEFDATPPGPVTSFKAASGNGQISLSWTNPADSDYVGTKILCRTTGYPASPTDGTVVCNRLAAPGSTDSYTQPGLVNGTRHYYAAFAYDGFPNYSSAANTRTTPAAEASIAQAKALADGQKRLMKGKVVSATYSGFFYIQELDRLQGLKVLSTDAVAIGNLVDVVGAIGGAGSERYIDTGGDPVIIR